ncbi:MAG: hypothetical protein HQ559_03550 [Lentisphaerae bacterium]|nr:hypothetical protein [Lentisphaerota bacterium]
MDTRETTADFCGRLPDGGAVTVAVRDRTIVSVTETPERVDDLPFILPVLFDAQQNGALGTFYTALHDHEPDVLREIADLLRRHGVGRCFMTMVTHPLDQLKETMARVGAWLDADEDLDALWPGIFHEGVHISPKEGWRGAQAPEWIRPPDWEALRELDELCGGRIRMVNVAPEEPGGLDFVQQAEAAGKIVALGHCCPDTAVIREAVARGASVVTHFANGAAPQIHRFRNPFWGFLDEPALRLGLICDGFHLPPEVVGTALKCKGLQGCFAVSDASGFSGCAAGEFARSNLLPFVIEANGHVHLKGSELLAGAWFQADRCVEWLVETQGMSLPAAWELCSTTPAEIFGINLPRLAEGEEASFVLARWDNGLVLEQCVHLGKSYLDEPLRPGSEIRT